MTATGDEPGRRSHAAALGAAGWLGLAAAPTFAVMALLTGMSSAGADMMCPAAHGVSSLSGMVPMYVLMSALHSAPWLKLISGGAEAKNHARHSAQAHLCFWFWPARRTGKIGVADRAWVRGKINAENRADFESRKLLLKIRSASRHARAGPAKSATSSGPH